MPQSLDPKQNLLLKALPTEEYERLLPHLKLVYMDFKEVLYDVNQHIEYVYFVLSGVVSILTIMEDHSIAEVGTVGNEGMAGLPVFLEASRVPGQAISQVPGYAMQMKAEVFKREVIPGNVLYRLLQRYTQAMFNQIAQTAACNRLHTIEERFCRWMLMTHDRVESDQFPLTQEFLSQMLGVRRSSVSVVASMIQKAGYIQYTRGKMTIFDREGLEATSCECYRTIKEEYERLVGGMGKK